MTTTTTRPARRPAGPPALRPPARPGAPRPADGRPRVDPRIAARRIAVRRDEGRRRLRRLLAVLGVLAALGGLAALTRTAALDVDHVRVRGTERLAADQVVAAAATAGLERGVPLVDVDLGAVERAVAALPPVAEADVRRRWPGTVTIEVTEREPVAAVPAAGERTALVAADGVAVELVAAGAGTGLPVIEGVGPVDEAGAVVDASDALATAAAMPEALHGAVEAVVAGDDGEVTLRLAAGGVARLGPAGALADKLAAVATMLEQADLGCLDVLDVRVPSVPAVTRVEGCGT